MAEIRSADVVAATEMRPVAANPMEASTGDPVEVPTDPVETADAMEATTMEATTDSVKSAATTVEATAETVEAAAAAVEATTAVEATAATMATTAAVESRHGLWHQEDRRRRQQDCPNRRGDFFHDYLSHHV